MVKNMFENVKSIEELLQKASDAEKEYLGAKRELKLEKARLGKETDWEAEFPDKKRVTEQDKKDFITLAVMDLQEDCDVAETGYHYMKELWELQKIILRIRANSGLEDSLDRIKGELESIARHLELLREEFGQDISGAIENVTTEIKNNWTHIQQIGADVDGVRSQIELLRQTIMDKE